MRGALQDAARLDQGRVPRLLREDLRQVRADPQDQIREQQGEAGDGSSWPTHIQEEAETRSPRLVLQSFRTVVQVDAGL